MKKNLSKAMAAAMAVTAVAPVVASADTISTYALAATDEVDVRLASGLELYENGKVLTRAEVYDFNGAGAKEYSKHTIKDKFKDMTIVYQDKTNDHYVLAKKSTNTSGVAAAKAKLESLEKEIAAYVADGYSKSESTTSSSVTGSTYKSGEKLVTLTKSGKDTIKITFTNIDAQSAQTDKEKETALTDDLREAVFGEDYTWDVEASDSAMATKNITSSSTVELSRVQYLIKKNLSKFDIVKEEINGNKDYEVVLYRKGADKEIYNVVARIVVKDFENIDEDAIIDVPVTNDFSSHWASDEILEAMLNGDVDASAKFRPQDGVTRAEFAKMLCTILTNVDVTTGSTTNDTYYDEDTTYSETFHDVSKGDWYQNYVAYLQQAGVVQGDGQNFRPNDRITRQEVAVMLTNALNKDESDNAAKYTVDIDGDGVIDAYKAITSTQLSSLSFKDKKEIKAWADHSVLYLSTTKNTEGDKIIQGDTKGYFNPAKDITRAEALVMVQRATK